MSKKQVRRVSRSIVVGHLEKALSRVFGVQWAEIVLSFKCLVLSWD